MDFPVLVIQLFTGSIINSTGSQICFKIDGIAICKANVCNAIANGSSGSSAGINRSRLRADFKRNPIGKPVGVLSMKCQCDR